jgi:hypothetical protein
MRKILNVRFPMALLFVFARGGADLFGLPRFPS